MANRDWQPDDDTVSFDDVHCIRATEKAILVDIDGDEHWIPQSHVHDNSEVYKLGQRGTLVITRWIATQRGLV